MSDQHRRSLTKTISWRIAGTIAVLQLMANTVLYYVHERIWNTIKRSQQ